MLKWSDDRQELRPMVYTTGTRKDSEGERNTNGKTRVRETRKVRGMYCKENVEE